ncbi:HdeD family acid-resistance protein [Roseixanthobacter liquoris]|uniref:HdeD family acid-resistance protein n=1 Tax=Roseixanthobacter liquoris TaxID=3119921 RepID=UPI0037278F2A
MIQLLLLLLGARLLRRHWWVLALAGALWLVLGLLFFADAFIDEIRIPPTVFAIPLLLDGALSVATFFGRVGGTRPLRLAKGLVFLAIGLLIIDSPWHSDMIIGFIVGGFLITDATLRAVSGYIVRFSGWRLSLLGAGVEFLLGVWSLVPWPTQWQAEVGADVGQLLMVSGFGICALALRIRHLPEDTAISTILSRGWPRMDWSKALRSGAAAEDGPSEEADRDIVIVHVWTPTGHMVSLNHGVSRYIAARDEKGAISTGHAALELPPDVYISHYPGQEIERSPSEFSRVLRATAENDAPGVFQPSYAEESADWCASTFQVRLAGLNTTAVRAFWAHYRLDTTYNLTNRNCSSVVAKALDAGLDGVFEERARSFLFVLQLVFSVELWVAGMLRHRAAAMAWTPGLVLDYARAVSALVEAPQRTGAGTVSALARRG